MILFLSFSGMQQKKLYLHYLINKVIIAKLPTDL